MVTVKLTKQQFADKSAELKSKYGVDISSSQGVIAKDGVTVGYHYDETAETLTARIVHKPFVVPESVAESKLREWLSA